MKKDIKILIIFILLYIINKLTRAYIDIPIIGFICKCYLNDFYCGIVFCAYCNIILYKSKYNIICKYYQFFLLAFVSGVIWEYVTPIFITYSVSDKYDILAYILGATVYYFFNKGR